MSFIAGISRHGRRTVTLPLKIQCPCLGELRKQPFKVCVRSQARFNSSSSKYLPRILDPAMWRSLVPTFLRRSGKTVPTREAREWNPASFFIIIFLLIGSQAIRMIGLQKDLESHMQKMDAKLEVLKRVVESIQKGEDVDVERMLGTGDVQKEREWEEALKEIEAEDSLWHPRGNEDRRRKHKSEKAATDAAQDGEPDNLSNTKFTQNAGSIPKFY